MNHYSVDIYVEITANSAEEAAKIAAKAIADTPKSPWLHGGSIYAYLGDEHGRPIEDHEEFV